MQKLLYIICLALGFIAAETNPKNSSGGGSGYKKNSSNMNNSGNKTSSSGGAAGGSKSKDVSDSDADTGKKKRSAQSAKSGANGMAVGLSMALLLGALMLSS